MIGPAKSRALLPVLVDEGLGWIDAGVPGPVGFDVDAAFFSGEPVVVAAPGPVFGVFYEAAFYRVAVEVAEFLGEFGRG